MAVTNDDLAHFLLLYEAQYLDADNLLDPAASGHGAVYPDHQTRSVLTWLEDVPAGWGGVDVPSDAGFGPPGYDALYIPPVARLWWVNNGRLVAHFEVRFTEQWFKVPIWSKENILLWSCPAPAKLGIWRYFDSSAVFLH